MSLSASIRTGLYGAMQLVGSATVTGAAATSITVNGLDLNSDAGYIIVVCAKNNTASSSTLSMNYNGDNTAGNYDREAHGFDGTTTTGGRANDAFIGILEASSSLLMRYEIYPDVDGKPTAIGIGREGQTTAIKTRYNVQTWRTAASITSLAVNSSVANAFAVGSYVKVYKIGAPSLRGTQIGYAYTESSTTASDTGGTPIPRDNTIPQNTEGVAYASLDTTINVAESASFLDVEVCIPSISSSTTQTMAFALFRDSTADAIATALVTVGAADYHHPLTLRVKVAAGSTGNTTFKLRWAAQTSTGYLLRGHTTSAFFNGTLKASMTVREIKQ